MTLFVEYVSEHAKQQIKKRFPEILNYGIEFVVNNLSKPFDAWKNSSVMFVKNVPDDAIFRRIGDCVFIIKNKRLVTAIHVDMCFMHPKEFDKRKKLRKITSTGVCINSGTVRKDKENESYT